MDETMILKTLALVILFFVDLSCIKDEPCIPCVAVFCEDYFIQILLFGSIDQKTLIEFILFV